jgi:hypothetical protein
VWASIRYRRSQGKPIVFRDVPDPQFIDKRRPAMLEESDFLLDLTRYRIIGVRRLRCMRQQRFENCEVPQESKWGRMRKSLQLADLTGKPPNVNQLRIMRREATLDLCNGTKIRRT